jgi:hypothetical protein
MVELSTSPQFPGIAFARFTMRSDGPTSCRTCTHAIGWTENHFFCQRIERVTLYSCGNWERGAGCDEAE